MNETNKDEIIVFNDEDLTLEVNVSPKDDTVWLTLDEISLLFDKNKSTISRHINNIFSEGELDITGSVAKNATELIDKFDPRTGKLRKTPMDIRYFNLDMIISVGYRVKSPRATKFRKWATSILKEYAIKGYVVNQKVVTYEQHIQLLKILGRTTNQLESQEILSVLENYTVALQLLDDYDHQKIKKPKGEKDTYELKYEECNMLINEMRKEHKTDVFGIEIGGAFKSSLGAIYQTYNGKELYPTLEEKAAHLLYFLVKNHGFIDGNKRIAAAIFVYFLEKNNALFYKNEQIIDNKTLVALTIMLAESNPNEKDLLINLIMTFLQKFN